MARRKITKTADQAVESVEKVTKEAPAEASAAKTGGETAEEEPVKATKAVKEKEPAKTTKTVRKKATAKTTKTVKEKEPAKETKTVKKPVRRKKAVKESRWRSILQASMHWIFTFTGVTKSVGKPKH